MEGTERTALLLYDTQKKKNWDQNYCFYIVKKSLLSAEISPGGQTEYPEVAEEASVPVSRPDSGSRPVREYTLLSVHMKVVLKPSGRAVWSQTESTEFTY